MLIKWAFENWIEIVGVLFSLIYLYFSVKQIVWLWPFGIFSAAFYIIIYFSSKLYADMGLQVYYLIISIYGWFSWSGTKGGNNSKMVIKRITNSEAWKLISIMVVLWVIIFWILKTLTNSDIAFWDALTTAGGIVATWMLARKIIEHWLVWLVIDTISMVMYIYKDLYVTVALFGVYSVIAIFGYISWNKSYQEETQS